MLAPAAWRAHLLAKGTRMQKLFDAHFHIIDPAYTLAGNNGFTPDWYTVQDYRAELAPMDLELVGGAVVSGSFQAWDQSYFEGALGKLGKGFVGVTQLDPATSDAELSRLDALGIKAIRFNLYRGLSATPAEIESLERRVWDACGWKCELYLDAAKIDDELDALIRRLPAVSIDHLGMSRLDDDALMRGYVAAGVPVRVTGFGRVEHTREQVAELVAALYQENPRALLFGTDLPATRARYRFSMDDVALVKAALGDEAAQDVLWKNGMRWYLGE